MTDEKETGLNMTQQHQVQAAIDAALKPIFKSIDGVEKRLAELADVNIDDVAYLLERFPPDDGEGAEPEPAETRAERQDRLQYRDEDELEEADYGGRVKRQDDVAERAEELEYEEA